MLYLLRKKLQIIDEMQSFTFININDINNKNLFNIILDKYKELYSYVCECLKNAP